VVFFLDMYEVFDLRSVTNINITTTFKALNFWTFIVGHPALYARLTVLSSWTASSVYRAHYTTVGNAPKSYIYLATVDNSYFAEVPARHGWMISLKIG